jgi:hypothetical protein
MHTRRIVFVLAALLLPASISAQAQDPKPQQQVAEQHDGGQGVDRFGGPVVDPSENVKALNEAATRRQDDLRNAFEKQVLLQLQNLEIITKLRDDMEKQRSDASKELRDAEINRIDSEAKLRADYAEKLSIAEAKRIDAIRVVDVNAVGVASQRASDQAQVLATQVSQSAEALRTLVATTASTVAVSQQQLASTLSARITTLEQAGYQQVGLSKFQDPQIASLVAEVKALSASRTDIAGIGQGRGDVVGWVVAGILLLISIIGTSVAIFTFMHLSKQPVQPVQPILPVEPVYNDEQPRSRRRQSR